MALVTSETTMMAMAIRNTLISTIVEAFRVRRDGHRADVLPRFERRAKNIPWSHGSAGGGSHLTAISDTIVAADLILPPQGAIYAPLRPADLEPPCGSVADVQEGGPLRCW